MSTAERFKYSLPLDSGEAAAQLLSLGADVTQALSEELMERGERMLDLSRQLAVRAVEMRRGIAPRLPVLGEIGETKADRSVGRYGAIDLSSASRVARSLDRFTRNAFAESTGLAGPAASKWLAQLTAGGLVRREPGSLEYVYVEPAADAPRAKHDSVESQFIGAGGPDRTEEIAQGDGHRATSNKSVNDMLAKARAAGWRVERTNADHLRCYPPGVTDARSAVRMGTTPSDRNTEHIVRRAFKAKGLLV